MTETKQPTDAELDAAWREFATKHETTGGFVRDFARAVLARWGAVQPKGEPVAAIHRDTLEMLQSGQCRPWDGGARLYPASKARFDTKYVGVYTSPQPMGRVPLTPDQISAMTREYPAEDLCGWSYRMGVADGERHHNIKQGGQHDD